MAWNYRVVFENTYSVREVFYDTTDQPTGWSADPMVLRGDTCEELREDLETMMRAFALPTLVVRSDAGKEYLVAEEKDSA